VEVREAPFLISNGVLFNQVCGTCPGVIDPARGKKKQFLTLDPGTCVEMIDPARLEKHCWGDFSQGFQR
jgi:hypothetical protein